jgi:hypothetical protein
VEIGGFKSFEGFKIVYVLGRDPAARLSFDVRLLDKAATPSPRYKSHDPPQAIQVGAYFPNLTQRCRSGLIDPRNVAWLHPTSSEELHISDSTIRTVHILEHDQIT